MQKYKISVTKLLTKTNISIIVVHKKNVLRYGMIAIFCFVGNNGRDELSLEDIDIEDDTDALNELLNS